MRILGVRNIVAVLSIILPCVADCLAAPGTNLRVSVELTDGSVIGGSPVTNQLKLSMVTGDVDVKLELVAAIQMESNRNARVLFRNDDKLSGRLSQDPIEIDALLGRLKIPPDVIAVIKVNSGPVKKSGIVNAQTEARTRNRCVSNLRQIELAKDSLATETGLVNGTLCTWQDLKPFVKDIDRLCCPAADDEQRTAQESYEIIPIGVDATCKICPKTHKLTGPAF